MTVASPPILTTPRLWSILATVALGIILTGCGGDSREGVPPSPEPISFFADDSVWNAPLADDAAIDPGSEARVAQLVRQVDEFGGWINTDQFSTPLYVVPEDQERVPVALNRPGCCPQVEADFREVPLPADAVPADGTDAHLTVWQPSTDTLWEFWQLGRVGDGWEASYGGRLQDVSTSDGVVPVGGATASSLPIIAGPMLVDEARAGEIPHELAMAIPFPQRDAYVRPALRTDGDGADGAPEEAQIPEGARFRLPADLDIAAQRWSPFTKMLARAAQRHGIVLRDKAGAVVFFGEDPRGRGGDPWPGLIGLPKNEIMDEFPWEELQLLELGEIIRQ